MKYSRITIYTFEIIIGVALVALFISLFIPLSYYLMVAATALLIVLLCYYHRRGYFSGVSYPVNLAIVAIAIGGIAFYNNPNSELLIRMLILAGAFMTFGYVLNEFKRSNKEMNSQEVKSIEHWDVYAGQKHGQAFEVMGGTILSETYISPIATNMSYKEAIKMLKQLYAEGKYPTAVSSKDYSFGRPVIDHNGDFISTKGQAGDIVIELKNGKA